MKKAIALLLCLLLMVPTGCKSAGRRYQATFLTLFDTVTTIIGFAKNEAEFQALSARVHDKLQEYHRLYDIYNSYEGLNNLKTVNDNAGVRPVKVDARILALLEFAKDMHKASDGKINIALGSVLRIWHDYRERGLADPQKASVPPMGLLQEAAKHTDIDKLILDHEASTAYLSDPHMRLDVGAVGKGYAVEQAALWLEGEGVSSLLLSVGGNVRAIGPKADGAAPDEGWGIAVQNPDKESEKSTLMTLQIDGLSVVSSGVYERFYTVDGVRYHHIIDPATLMPAAHYLQVTIVCRDSGLGDALSTIAFNEPIEKGLGLINAMEGVEAAWVLADGSLRYSNGFAGYIKAA